MPLLHIGGYEWLDWNLNPDVVALCILLLGAYAWAAGWLRPRVAGAGPFERDRAVAFVLGVLVIYAASGSPLHDLADRYLVSAHMLQHVLLMLVAAPLLLVGVPVWLWQQLLRPRAVTAVTRVVVHPVMALAVFNVVLLLGHLPSSVDLQQREWGFHLFIHVSLVAAGLVMWWPVLSSVPELPRVSYPVQMIYLFLQSIVPAVMASFVTFSDRFVYDSYAESPRIWGISPLDDQQMAGGIMKLAGSLILWSFMAIAFFKWYEAEEAEARGSRLGEAAPREGGPGLTLSGPTER